MKELSTVPKNNNTGYSPNSPNKIYNEFTKCNTYRNNSNSFNINYGI